MQTIDQIYHCQIPSAVFGDWHLNCHLRIVQSQRTVQTVIITVMGFEIGWFYLFVVGKLVDQIVQEFHLDPVQLVWIEHYLADYRDLTQDDFNQVLFDWQDGKATNPQWVKISPAAVQALLREDVSLPQRR